MAPPPVIKRKRILSKLSYCNKSYYADYSCLNLALLFGFIYAYNSHIGLCGGGVTRVTADRVTGLYGAENIRCLMKRMRMIGLKSFKGECSSLMNYFALFCGPRFNCMKSLNDGRSFGGLL